MAKITIERWRCDRCGIEAGRWLKPGSAYQIRASVDHGTAGGSMLDWRELCTDCNTTVEKAIRELNRDADLAREERAGGSQ